jgi:paraquat-inducible protein B
MAEAKAQVSERRRISSIWVIPIVAMLLGVWMLVYSYQNRGPEIEIVFETAEGVEAGKTKVKMREVEIGLVESVRLSDDLQRVVVRAQLDKEARPLLRDDTEFWVVRARLGASGVSGIATLLSGGYIQLSPGSASGSRRSFVGLEVPPVTPAGAHGLHFELTGDKAGSVGAGDPILHKGFEVGQIESATLDIETGQMRYAAFIQGNYVSLVSTSTRFWNASGFSFTASADGIDFQTGSLQTLLVGGVAFGLPDGVPPGDAVERGASFRLHPDRDSVNRRPHEVGLEYVVRFDQSVRGLHAGAPVEYRGIRLGRVERILLEEMTASLGGSGAPMAVLIRLEPGRLTLPDTEESAARLRQSIIDSVANGLRATMSTGNLLTGSKYVSLDVHRREPPAEMGTYAGRPTIPTMATGLEGLETQVSDLLDKLNSLPLDQLARSATTAVDNAGTLLASEGLQQLPDSLEATLAELRSVMQDVSANSELQERLGRTLVEFDHTLQSLRQLLDTLDEQPSSLIFDRVPTQDPVPPAGER